MFLLASIVDWDALLKTVAVSLLAGVGVTFTFSLAIYGAARTAELRRADRPLAAGGAATLMIAGLATSLAAIALGFVVMTSK